MSRGFKKISLKELAIRLLAKETFFSSEDKHQVHQSLKAILYELRKQQLEQVCVSGEGHNKGQCEYTELEKLISRINKRIQVLPKESIELYI